MKITLQANGKTVTVEDDKVIASDVVELFASAMIAYGFHKETVAEALDIVYQEFIVFQEGEIDE